MTKDCFISIDKKHYYLLLILTHVLLGVFTYNFPIISKIFSLLIFIVGIYFIVKNRNINNEALYLSAYVVGLEVFLRMTHGNPIHEFGKYTVITFMLIGMFYKGVSKSSYPYFIFLLFLIPSLITDNITFMDLRKRISFNLSGPICLAICSIYIYKMEVTVKKLNIILLTIALPIISISTYIFIKCPLAIKGTIFLESSAIMSGNYAPNQVSTVLGLGMFVFCYRAILCSSNKKVVFLNLIISSILLYRGLLTFSRGGMIVGIVMILILLLFIFIYKKQYEINLLTFKTVTLFLFFSSTISLTIYQTNGLIINRYTNKLITGKNNVNNQGRKFLALKEIEYFTNAPILGNGVGSGTVKNKSEIGIPYATHNEITRMLSEHGTLGLISIIFLIVVPFLLYIKNKQNIFLVFFFTFWFLTINHSAMRIAAPSFFYALSLLNIDFRNTIFNKN